MKNPEIHGVLFDMDGTLIDSEQHTSAAVQLLLDEHNLGPMAVDPGVLFGITWEAVAERVLRAHQELSQIDVTSALQDNFSEILDRDGLVLIPGSDGYFSSLEGRCKRGLYTSNVRTEVDRLLSTFPVFAGLDGIVTGEDVSRSKPDPEGFLLLAATLGIAPEHCVVFEDSVAGLTAAKEAGMRTIGVTHRCSDETKVERIADRVVTNYADFAGLLP